MPLRQATGSPAANRHECIKRIAQILAAAALYYGAARLGLLLAFDKTNASPVWPPSGIGLALLLLFGFRLWPGILLGAFLANLTVFLANQSAPTPSMFLASGLIALGNSLEAVVGYFLLSRWGIRNPLTRAQDVFRFVLAAPLMCLASACIGPIALAATGMIPWTLFGTVWVTWWLGDVAGVLVVTPLVLSWYRKSWIKADPRWPAEAALLAAVLLFACRLTFSDWIGGNVHAPLAFLPIPLLVWAAFRFGPCGGATAIALTSALAVWATIHGRGPFGTTDVNAALTMLQMFLGVVTITVLVVAATVQERTDAACALRRAHDDLEVRVLERTAELESANQSMVQEVTVRRRAEQVLEMSQARLAEAQAVAHLGSWEWDVARNEVTWTEELYRMHGLDSAVPVTYESFLDRVHPDDQQLVGGAVQRAAEDHQPFFFDHRIIRADGEVRWIHRRGRVEFDATGPIRMFGTAHEITERRQTEDALRALTDRLQRSNRALEEFASVAAHELQEPLRKIKYFAERTVRPHDPMDAPPRAAQDTAPDGLKRMHSAVGRMQSLIHDLLEIAMLSHKPESVSLVDLGQVAGEVVADLELRIAQVGACVEIGPMPQVEADRTQIRQLLQNLVANALKFHRTEVRPTIRLSSEYMDSGTGTTRSARGAGSYCRVVVEDNGIGFEPSQAERIFAVFERLHGRSVYEGTGIGLSICRKIADLHGGTICAEGTPGRGARFIIVLPTRQELPRPVMRPAPASEEESSCTQLQ